MSATEKVLACIAADGCSDAVVDEALRTAQAFNAPWVALYVETPELARLPTLAREKVLRALNRASRLGAETFTLGSIEIAPTILEVAHAQGITRIIVGRPTRAAWRPWAGRSVVDALLSINGVIPIHIVGPQGRARGPQDGAPHALPDLARGDKRRRWPRYIAATALLLGTGAIGLLLQSSIPNVSVVTLYLLSAMLAGLYLGQGPAVFTAIGGGLSFNLLFTEPRFTLHIYRLSDVVNFAALLAVGLVVAQLSARARHQARVAVHREQRAVSLGAFTGALLSAQTEAEIATVACDHIGRAFDAQVDLWLRKPSQSDSVDCISSGSLADVSLPAVRHALKTREAVGMGTSAFVGPLHYMPVVGAGQAIGVLVIKARLWKRLLLPEPRKALQSYAHQLALALERVQLLQQKELSEIAIRAEDLRNNLLAGLSHDLRTPLASILGSSSALVESRHELPAAWQRELIETIHEETLRMTRLVTNLLEMARLTQGFSRLNREWIPIEELIGSVRHRLSSLLNRRAVTVFLEPDLPLAFLDGLLFEQVLQNLLENAVKYSPDGSDIEITVTQAQHNAQRCLRIVVADRGIGVPLDAKEMIFAKFHRAHEESAQSGVGLGLALCRSIVLLHGGDIGVQDRDGGGSEFWVTLPLPDEAPRIAEQSVAS